MAKSFILHQKYIRKTRTHANKTFSDT